MLRSIIARQRLAAGLGYSARLSKRFRFLNVLLHAALSASISITYLNCHVSHNLVHLSTLCLQGFSQITASVADNIRRHAQRRTTMLHELGHLLTDVFESKICSVGR